MLASSIMAQPTLPHPDCQRRFSTAPSSFLPKNKSYQEPSVCWPLAIELGNKNANSDSHSKAIFSKRLKEKERNRSVIACTVKNLGNGAKTQCLCSVYALTSQRKVLTFGAGDTLCTCRLNSCILVSTQWVPAASTCSWNNQRCHQALPNTI